jgi:ABC-type Fe3+ transport system permease subunit
MKRSVLAWAVLALVLLCALAPTLALIGEALERGDEVGGVLASARSRALLLRSLGVAGGAAGLALVLGLLAARSCARLAGRRAAAGEAALVLPLCVPSLVTTLGWLALLGRNGALARMAPEFPRPDLYTPAGAAVLLALGLFPCVALPALAGQRALDRGALAAARLAAGPWRVFWRIEWPLLAPYLASGTLVAFLLAFMDFGVPSALMVNVYPVEVFTQLGAFQDTGRALASATPGLVVVALAVALRFLALRASPWPASTCGRGPRVPGSGAALLAVLALALGAPLAALLVSAHGHYAEALRTAGEEVLTSLSVGAFSAALLLPAAAAAALAVRALGPRARRLAGALLLVPLVVPGAIVGLGLLTLVARDVAPFAWLRGSVGLLACASFARFLALPALGLALFATAFRRELVDAAEVHGARRSTALARIVLPLALPALVHAAALAFVLALGELPAAVLVAPPGGMTLAVRIESLLHFGKDGIVAALCVVEAGLVFAVLALACAWAGMPGGGRAHAPRAR